MELPVFLHIEATPNLDESQALQAYLSQVPSIVEGYGGIPIATYDVEKALDDNPQKPAVFAVLSFPSRASIEAFFQDPDYLAIVPLRERGFNHIRFYVTSERI